MNKKMNRDIIDKFCELEEKYITQFRAKSYLVDEWNNRAVVKNRIVYLRLNVHRAIMKTYGALKLYEKGEIN